MAERVVAAFGVGGMFGVCGQLFIWIWEFALGAGNPLAGPLAMGTLGIAGFALSITGVASKLLSKTAMGVAVPVSGFVIAVSDVMYAHLEQVEDGAQAVKRTATIPLMVLGGGTVICVGVCLAATAIGLVSGPAPAPSVPPGEIGALALSFCASGLVSAAAECVLIGSRKPMPGLMLVFMVVGALLAALGFSSSTFASCGGYSVSILAAGQGVFVTFGLLLGGNSAILFPAVMLTFCFVSLLGMAAGALRWKLAR